MKENQTNYINHLKNIIYNSSKYIGKDIEVMFQLKNLYINGNILKEIDSAFCNFNFEKIFTIIDDGTDMQNIAHTILIKDIEHKYFFAVIIEPVELWQDDYLYKIQEVTESKYNNLAQPNDIEGLR